MLGRWWPLLLMAAVALLIYASGAYQYATPETLAARQADLRQFVDAHPLEAASGFVIVYGVFLTLSLPGAGVLTLAAGLLFGNLIGTALAVAGAVGAAVAGFLAIRLAISQELGRWHGPRVDRLRRKLEADGVNYLLAMRLLPILPFTLVSLLAVLAGIRLGPYTLTSLIGIVPPTLVFVSLGDGLGSVIAQNGGADPLGLLGTRVVLPLAGLALFSVLPVIWRRWRDRGGAG